jgi:HNH endonuclease
MIVLLAVAGHNLARMHDLPHADHRPPLFAETRVRQQVLMEAGYHCGNPTCRHILTLQLHHIVWVKDEGSNDPANLLALCPNCHSLHTIGEIPESAIRHWKYMLLALNHAFDRESLDLLLFLRAAREREGETEGRIGYSADGLLRFARLIGAGLVDFGLHSINYRARTRGYYVQLTESGELLVEAWIQGDEDKYRRWLDQPANWG